MPLYFSTRLHKGVVNMKKWLLIIIGAVDALLLGLIVVSAATGWRATAPTEQKNTAASTQPHPETQEASFPTAEKATLLPATEQEETTAPTEAPTQAPTEAPTQAPTQAPKPAYPSADEVSTDDYPSLGDVMDFRWSKSLGPYWNGLSQNAVGITDFSAVKGGWKAYLLDDPSGKHSTNTVEHIANIRISGSESAAQITIDWYITFFGDESEEYDDNSPDTEFSGTWSGGEISALGTGKITLSDFYYDNGREYAVGVYSWPDSTESIIALVRP